MRMYERKHVDTREANGNRACYRLTYQGNCQQRLMQKLNIASFEAGDQRLETLAPVTY